MAGRMGICGGSIKCKYDAGGDGITTPRASKTSRLAHDSQHQLPAKVAGHDNRDNEKNQMHGMGRSQASSLDSRSTLYDP